jgi:hypothetical protein
MQRADEVKDVLSVQRELQRVSQQLEQQLVRCIILLTSALSLFQLSLTLSFYHSLARSRILFCADAAVA